MVGIYCVINGEGYDINIKEDLHDRFEYSIGACKLTIVSIKDSGNYGIYETDDEVLLYYGNVFYQDKKIEIKKIGELFNREKEKIVEIVDGEFNFVLLNKAKMSLKIFTDTSGVLPLYIGKYNSKIVFSNSIEFVASSFRNVLDVNIKAIHNFIRFGSVLGNNTFFNDIQSLRNGDCVDINMSSLSLKFWNNNIFEYNEIYNESYQLEQIHSTLQNAIRKRLYRNKLGVTLSGGLDSRLILYMLGREINNENLELNAFTWGQKGSDEILIAEEVARSLNVNLFNYELKPEDFLMNHIEYSRITGGMDPIFQSYMIEIGKKMSKNANLIFTGFVLDVLLGGTFVNEELISCNNTQFEKDFDKYEKLLKLNVFSNDDLTLGINNRFKSIIRDHKNDYYSEIVNVKTDRLANKVKECAINNRDLNMVLFRNTVPAQFCEHAYPNRDIAFMKAVRELPVEYKLNHKFYRKFLMDLSKEMSDIKYHNTGLPVSVPIEYWNEGTAIELSKERLNNKIYVETGVDFPYKYYYSNFNQWTRSNEYWKEFIDTMLLNKESVVGHVLFKQDYIKKLVDDNFRWKNNNQRKISYLLTVESFFRSYNIRL